MSKNSVMISITVSKQQGCSLAGRPQAFPLLSPHHTRSHLRSPNVTPHWKSIKKMHQTLRADTFNTPQPGISATTATGKHGTLPPFVTGRLPSRRPPPLFFKARRRGRGRALCRGRPRVEAGGRAPPRRFGRRRRLRSAPLPSGRPRCTCSPAALPGGGAPARARPLPPSGLGAGALAATAGRGRQHGGVSGGGLGSTTTAAAASARPAASPPRPAQPSPARQLGGARSSRPAAGRRPRLGSLGLTGHRRP